MPMTACLRLAHRDWNLKIELSEPDNNSGRTLEEDPCRQIPFRLPVQVERPRFESEDFSLGGHLKPEVGPDVGTLNAGPDKAA